MDQGQPMKSLNFLQTLSLTRQMIKETKQMFTRPYWSREEIEHYQLQQIKKIIGEAKYYVPLYQRRNLPEPSSIASLRDLAKIKPLTKNELLEAPNFTQLNTRFNREDLIVSKSSGSTGKALDVYYDQASFNLFIIAGLRLFFMGFPYYPWHKQTYIYTSPYPLNSLFGLYPMEFISTLNPIEDTISRLRKNPPDILVCYPSHLRSIAEKMTKEDFNIIRPKAINVNSEMSSKNERAYLSERFSTFVFDEYSSEELTRIASQCRYLNYHLFEDINYIEILDEEGEALPEGQIGSIVGTNLHNMAMPLIRYNQGDRGAIRSRRCECGRNFRILETLEGRKNDAFVLSTGESISSGFLLDLTYSVFLDYPHAVLAFSLVQNEPDKWSLELVPGPDWSENLATQIPNDLKKKLARDQVAIDLKIVKEVRKTASGKANPIISLVKK
jgi:phenylacetate-CoA ligase